MPCDPLRDLRAWQERLERLAAQHATAWAPPIDVYETDDRYVITAEVPGVGRDEVELALQDNRLTIRGSRSGAVGEGQPGGFGMRSRHRHRLTPSAWSRTALYERG